MIGTTNAIMSTPPPNKNYIPRTIVYMSDNTFVVPQNGKYIITVIGHGGSGGRGIHAGSSYSVTGGSGGGGGGIAKSILTLVKDESVAITCNDSLSSFGNYLSAAAGSNGALGDSSSKTPNIPAGGAGGAASGGNIGNYNGQAGETATSVRSAGTKGGSTAITTIGGHSINSGSGYFPFNNLTGNSTAGAPGGTAGLFGGGTGGASGSASGGWGGAAFGGGGSGGASYSGSGSASNSYGGNGGSGAVIIEYLEEI